MDKEVGEAFLALLVEEAKRFKPADKETLDEINNGSLAPFLLNSEF